MPLPDDVVRKLTAAHQEALRVGDSPARADQLISKLGELTRAIADADASEEVRIRVRAALADAERVLRRDDDGREAAKHIQTAIRLAGDRPRPPPPF